ncbi:MAG: DUF1559 domain-containing protein [Planctomycetota bacterium]
MIRLLLAPWLRTESLCRNGYFIHLRALILPILRSARSIAYKAGCASNLRQIGLALEMYLHDYNGFFPQHEDCVPFFNLSLEPLGPKGGTVPRQAGQDHGVLDQYGHALPRRS